MDLTQLRTFVAVAQEGHLTRAAERLHISQPTASTHIRGLETDLGVALFARSNRGLELTRAGRILAESAERVLAASIDLQSLARELRGGVGGRVAIGMNADPVLSRLGTLVRWLRQHHPVLDLNIEMRSSLATRQGVRAGELDAGFLLSSALDRGLTGLSLARLEYRIVGPADWRSRIDGADWKALAVLPWIVTAPGTSNNEMRDELFAQHGLTVNAAVEANNDLLLRTLIAEGVGVGLVRADHAAEGARNGRFALSDLGHASTKLLFAYPDARERDPIIQALVEGVREAWPEAQRME